MALKLHVLSDLHLGMAGFTPPETDADVIVLAGDIARPREAIAWAARFGRPVLYVAGNHEFYGGSIGGTRAALRELAAGTRVQVLDDSEVHLGGVRILGTTLWTDLALYGDSPQAREATATAAQRFLRDFQRIRLADDDEALFTPQACASLFGRHAAWLQERLRAPHDGPTVVITHHAPSPRSIHPRFEGSPINACFVSRAEHLLGAPVDLWIHGHTHDSFDYEVAGTRVLCNPRGYVRDGQVENAAFDPGLVVTVG